MDALSSRTSASRRSWSKPPPTKKKVAGRHHRNEELLAGTLPVLARHPSGQQLPRNNSLTHAFLASQLEGNERDSYSRSQLRAMASSKLLSGSNNNVASTNARIRERLAPLDPASVEKARAQQRRALPEPLQATINDVLAVRNADGDVGERGDSRDDSSNVDEPETPTAPVIVKRKSPCKAQLQSRRPEWRRYIHRILMTKGIQGSTLARYRRLVGIVARKNLTRSLAGAAERVVRYRLEFRSAVMIQTMILRVLTQRRQAKHQERHRAAVAVQHVWRRMRELKQQHKLEEANREAMIDRVLRSGATRSIQRSYRKYRHTCYLRAEERREQEHASMLQKARLKLLRKYQSWREHAKRDKLGRKPEFTVLGDEVPSETRADSAEKEFCSGPEESEVCSVGEVTANCFSIDRKERGTDETEAQQEIILNSTEQASAPIDALVRKSDERLNDPEPIKVEGILAVPDHDQSTGKHENFTSFVCVGESQSTNHDELAADDSSQDNQSTCESRSSPFQDIEQRTREAVAASFEAKTDEPAENNESDESNEGEQEVDTPIVLSDPHDLQQLPDHQANAVEEDELAALAAAATAAITRTTAAGIIVCFLLPKWQARHVQKTHAVVLIQCLARSYLAKQWMDRVRQAALHSLRAQLLASWYSLQKVEKLSDQDTHDPVLDNNNDEDDELDLELQGYHPSPHGVPDNCLHVLPTRNGQIPPGVQPLQSSAGAPLLSLWKWSWPGERWLSNGQ
ncbi:hypothetical protein PHYPSEUDO_005333 [Phytophthora pseudosyringae]|uniref:Uncharacterized protein n=1 Tax=Phytophthora pseudosyringae TaxID=221518 RepID=A0A8T1VLC1_9STRA|nr:hypothetical protein PHYPSEUDO_005333 [Phytophthora pseudosyringae]